MSIGDGIRSKGRRANNVPFLTHPGEPVDLYAVYLSEGPQLAGNSSNPRNLFDDSNKKDGKWLKITRKHLSNWSELHNDI